MKKIKFLIEKIESTVEGFSMIVLVSIVIVVFINVVSRAIFSYSFQWSEELPLILLNWFTILGMAIAVGRKNHVAIEYFYSKLNIKNKKFLSLVVYIVSSLLGVIFLYFGMFNINENLNVIMPATGLSQSIKYIMLPISGCLMILYSLMDIVELFINEIVLKTMLEEDIAEAEEIMIKVTE